MVSENISFFSVSNTTSSIGPFDVLYGLWTVVKRSLVVLLLITVVILLVRSALKVREKIYFFGIFTFSISKTMDAVEKYI